MNIWLLYSFQYLTMSIRPIILVAPAIIRSYQQEALVDCKTVEQKPE